MIELTGSDGRNEIKAKLKKLIDRELENRKNAKEGNVGQDSNDDSLTMPSEQKKKVTNLDKIFETKTFGRPLLKRD
ncbi:hypothetical protein ABMX65_12695 [Vibrio vulnificus]|uniref:hypothetical protein n=1 Tax=Vibrio vulnificus TaxID=672 RepID=UPI004058236C